MATFTITGFNTTNRTLTGNEYGTVTKDGELIVTDGTPVLMNGNALNYVSVNGSVQAISGSLYSAFAMTGFGGIFMFGPTATIIATQGRGLIGEPIGFFDLDNAGTILAGNDGVNVVETDGAFTGRIANSGKIHADGNAVILSPGTNAAQIVNTGQIIGASGAGIIVNLDPDQTGGSIINNAGYVFGSSEAFVGGPGVDSIYNTGTFDGPMFLRDDNDRYEGAAGVATARIDGGNGNDTISGGATSDTIYGSSDDDLLVGRGGDDSLDGGPENDTILGGDGNDSIDGGFDDDVLSGNAGDDTILGNIGNDVLVGQDGSDVLEGGRNNDTMDGGAGSDILEGDSGNDILRGRSGEDELAGGLGRDFLTGGVGADSFVFRSASETVVGANRDQILDFAQGIDLIVVAGLSPGVFEFRGTAGFAPSGNPELRLFETPTGSTIVQFDVDGDGTQDAEIRVANITGLTADDFTL